MAPKKRARKDEQPRNNAPVEAEVPVDRREAMAQVARRRAAHFANFNETGESDMADNIHAGGDDARTLGPWSSAVELVNNRAKAQAEREGKFLNRSICDEAADDWEPQRDISLGPHPKSNVRLLSNICMDLLVEYVDCVESLVGVAETIRVKLAEAVCVKRKMSPEVAPLFVTQYQTEVMLPDCTQLDKASLSTVLDLCDTTRLQRLILAVCGRGFTDAQATHFAAKGPWNHLISLTLGGAYCLSDEGLLKVLSTAPNLVTLSIPQGSRLTGGIEKLPGMSPQLRDLNIQDCRGITTDVLIKIIPQLPALRTIVLDGIHEVDDAVVKVVAKAPLMKSVSISYTKVTDAGVMALALSNPALEVLRMDSCHGVSEKGMMALASGCKHLQVLSIRCCNKLTDECLAAVAARGMLQQLIASRVPNFGSLTMCTLAASCANSLESLDVSFCRLVTEAALGVVADACSKLECLKIFGCSQIGPKFLFGHSNKMLSRDGAIMGVGTHSA